MFNMMKSSQSGYIVAGSSKLIRTVDYLTQITCWVMCEAI